MFVQNSVLILNLLNLYIELFCDLLCCLFDYEVDKVIRDVANQEQKSVSKVQDIVPFIRAIFMSFFVV